MATSAHHSYEGHLPLIRTERSPLHTIKALCVVRPAAPKVAKSLCGAAHSLGRVSGGEPWSDEASFLRTVALPWQPRIRTDGCPTILDEPGCAWLRAFPNPHTWGPAVHFSVPSF